MEEPQALAKSPKQPDDFEAVRLPAVLGDRVEAELAEAPNGPIDDLGISVGDPEGAVIGPLGVEYASEEALLPRNVRRSRPADQITDERDVIARLITDRTHRTTASGRRLELELS